MVGVVVVDAGAVALALELEAPSHPGETRERLRAGLGVEAGERQPAERRERVGDVVATRNPEQDLGVDSGAAGAEAAAPVRVGPDVGRDQVGVGRRLAGAPARGRSGRRAGPPAREPTSAPQTRPAAGAAKAAKASESSASELQREW